MLEFIETVDVPDGQIYAFKHEPNCGAPWFGQLMPAGRYDVYRPIGRRQKLLVETGKRPSDHETVLFRL